MTTTHDNVFLLYPSTYASQKEPTCRPISLNIGTVYIFTGSFEHQATTCSLKKANSVPILSILKGDIYLKAEDDVLFVVQHVTHSRSL